MRRICTTLGETLGGLCSLLRLGWQTKFRFSGPYWRWRHETAFGRGEPPAGEKRRAILHYARWMWRMGRAG